MAFTAMHAQRGRLDASRDDLGCGWAWEAVHRARPRVPLACPECGHGMHAKRSPTRIRFFAHDAGAPRCALAGESMEHHLLKLQLATEIRAAGWSAELEVRAPHGAWRADVMATSPDGGRRIAWEAQLSAITEDEIRARTARLARDGVAVCWVATRPRPWLGSVPSIRVTAPGTAPDGGPTGWEVAAGLARFQVQACRRWCACARGHGDWQSVTPALGDFVSWVLAGRIAPYRAPADGRYRLRADGRPWQGHWSAPAYAATAAEHDRADREELARAGQAEREREASLARREQARRRESNSHAHRLQGGEAVEAWRNKLTMVRRWKLEDAAAHWAAETSASTPYLDHGAFADPHWGGGVPLLVDGAPYAVLRPYPPAASWEELAGLVILTADPAERHWTINYAPDDTQVIDLSPLVIALRTT
ncbi:competence protein CoiA-like protein [Streptomyces sp. TLI_235]|nr:competence protein CoiA family protein [Streptomyces sp. TLI_235]PBC69782.1 competence protein CoiA-like protein [Streptomyces sp. TLI_235]